MKTLVLGASGFIGGAFLKQNLNDEIEIAIRSNNIDVTGFKNI